MSVSTVDPSSVALARVIPTRSQLAPANAYQSAPLPFDPVLVAAGVNVASRSAARTLFGWKRYPGRVEDICHAVIADCWTGKFFAGSAGHFKQFWTRDLAMCTPALCRLGFRERVIQSWQWGLEHFERVGKLTTTIFNRRFPRDVYAYACDSLPLTLFALRAAGAEHLILKHRALFSREIERFEKTVFDQDSGMARSDGYFSGPRDCMTGRSTVFANTTVALLANLFGPGQSAAESVRWNRRPGDAAAAPLDGRILPRFAVPRHPVGRRQHLAVFFEIFTDTEMQRSAFATLERRGFTSPIPLRYFEQRMPDSELPIPRAITPNYQGDPSWTQLGPLYLHLLAKIDPNLMQQHRARMAAFIERDGNYLELYKPNGRPYKGRALLYHADEGMIWASLFLDLYK